MYVTFKKTTKAILITLLSGVLFILSANAQTGTINVRGTITDDTGEAVIGANIRLQGTSLGTVTDFDGHFTLQAPADGVLEISYIGYRTQEIAINNRTTINVVMEEDSEMLEELVVIGYGTVKKDDATGSVIAISADKINRGLATSPADLLAGQIAGVSVISSGGAPALRLQYSYSWRLLYVCQQRSTDCN